MPSSPGWVRGVAFMLASFLGASAMAAPPDDPPAGSFPGQTVFGRSYGWQILLADVGSIALLASGAALSAESRSYAFVPIIGGMTYVADAPLIYAAHGDTGRIPWSVGRRILLPLAGFAVGAGIGALAARSSSSDDCSVECQAGSLGLVFFGIGTLSAMIYDWSTAREPDRTVPTPVSKATGAVWAPILVLGPRNRAVGITVRF